MCLFWRQCMYVFTRYFLSCVNKVSKASHNTGINLWFEFIDTKTFHLENLREITKSQIAYFSLHLKSTCLKMDWALSTAHLTVTVVSTPNPECLPGPETGKTRKCWRPRNDKFTCWAPLDGSCQSPAAPSRSGWPGACLRWPGSGRSAPPPPRHSGARSEETITASFTNSITASFLDSLYHLSYIRVYHKMSKVSLDHNIFNSKHYCQIKRWRRIEVICSWWDILVVPSKKAHSLKHII